VRLRSAALQGLGLGVAAAVLWWLARNTAVTLEQNGIGLGFGFLGQPAGFDIGETPIAYSPADTFLRAIAVGLVNTLRASVVGWVLSITLGFVLGILRLADNPAVRGLARSVVELVRNVPLLLLLLFLAATMHALPPAREALEPIPGVFISNRGLVLPTLGSVPRLEGFNFVGGLTLSPELTALVAALTLHHAAHISEVVRGAILGVSSRQRDAAHALGLSRAQTLRFVVVPQALRAMVPLLATNCVSLTKNSSLAVAIGFPDVVSILNTTANQTGHAIETMLIMIAVYLTLSLAVAFAMNAYNRRVLRPAV
jgi:general L-amino acid transport system permease protein